MGHHHELLLTGVMELRPDQLKHHHEVSPKGSWNYVLTTYDSYSTNQVILIMHISLMPTFYNQPSFMFHVKSIPTHHSQTMGPTIYVAYPNHVKLILRRL